MKQVLLRVPDDLHARLAERARRAHRSVNAVANDILDAGVADETGDARATLRAKARRLGLLANTPTRAVSDEARSAALASTQGIGPILDDLLEHGR